jgi:CDP-diacylglycerol--serine O-phosphatidyltransferase
VRDPRLVSAWLVLIALLAISSLPTVSWGKLRPPRSVRLLLIVFIGLAGAAALTEPWWTLVGICVVYLSLIPVGLIAYGRVKRRRAAAAAQE